MAVARALIISCSRRKRRDREPLAALERYDGPAFRVLRRYLNTSERPKLGLRIISAELGLIPPTRRIKFYDRQMTPRRAKEIEPEITAAFKPFCRKNAIDDLMVLAGPEYMTALSKCWPLLPQAADVHVPTGSIGGRVSQLRDWLYGEQPLESSVLATGFATLRGKKIVATAVEVFAMGRARFASEQWAASQFESWAVRLDEHLVAPKWLVSRLSGLPVSGFRTDDALTVLRRLGVRVERVNLPGSDRGRGTI